jgi:hypothetical protein
MIDKHPKKPNDTKALARWNNEGGAPASGDVSTRKKRPKRSRDLNQRAEHMVDLATGEIEDRGPTPREQGKNPAAVELGRRGGSKGGTARADTLPSARRQEIAGKAAMARWAKD